MASMKKLIPSISFSRDFFIFFLFVPLLWFRLKGQVHCSTPQGPLKGGGGEIDKKKYIPPKKRVIRFQLKFETDMKEEKKSTYSPDLKKHSYT